MVNEGEVRGMALQTQIRIVNHKSNECSKKYRTVFKFIRLFIGIVCFSTCLYQIYDRIEYYLSRPVRANVDTMSTNITMPKFSISEIDTELLRPYWEMHKPTQFRHFLRSYLSSIAFNLPYNFVNYTEFWSATNVTSNMDMVQVMDRNSKAILSEMHFSNGDVTYSTGKQMLRWSEESTILGLETTYRIGRQIKLGTAVHIRFRYTGYNKPSRVMYSFDTLLPFSDRGGAYFGTNLTLIYSITTNKFLSTPSSPCESREIVRQKCMLSCLAKEFKNRGCLCKLPYMPSEEEFVDCNESRNSNKVATITYYKSLKFLKYVISNRHCPCLRPCTKTILYRNVSAAFREDDSKFSFVYYSKDAFVTEVREEYAYDILSLFADIGGAAGLFLGISVLSIFNLAYQFGTRVHKQISLRHNGKFAVCDASISPNSHSDENTNNTKKHNPKWLTYCKILCVIILTFSSISLIYTETIFYLSDPTKVIIEFVQQDKVILPNVIACGQGEEIANWKRQYAGTNDTAAECQLHFLDAIDHVFTSRSIVDVWNSQGMPCVVTGGNKINMTRLSMFSGNCIEVVFDLTIVRQSDTLPFSFMPFGNLNCIEQLFQMYIRSPEVNIHSSIMNQIDLFYGDRRLMELESFIINRYNSSTRLCVNFRQFDDCILNCYKQKLQQLVTCRLPHMENVTKPWCATSANAKIALSTYLTIVLSNNVKEDCKCIQPCTETIHRIHWISDDIPRYENFAVEVYISAMTDIIQHITELPVTNFVSLLCAIGNILGVTLGLSVLSMFHSILSYCSFK